MSTAHRLRAWLNYKRTADSKHGVHSPFVFDLLTKILPPVPGESFEHHPAEQQRRTFLNHTASIDVLDLGTGKSGPRKIADIAQRAAKTSAQGQALHRLVRHWQPRTMLELGTSLGITTTYQATAAPHAQFITIEGCPQTAAQASAHLHASAPNVDVRVGDFDAQLPNALQTLQQIDYVYFDGNHRREPTLRYFETCLPFAHNNTLFIFDDIHWSADMEAAWATIHAHPQATVSIDLFDFGLIFFRQEQRKQHFVLKF